MYAYTLCTNTGTLHIRLRTPSVPLAKLRVRMDTRAAQIARLALRQTEERGDTGSAVEADDETETDDDAAPLLVQLRVGDDVDWRAHHQFEAAQCSVPTMVSPQGVQLLLACRKRDLPHLVSVRYAW